MWRFPLEFPFFRELGRRLRFFFILFFTPPIDFEVTRAGQSFIVATIVIGTLAIRFENGFLFLVLSIMIAAILTSGILNHRSLAGLRGRREYPAEIFAATPFPLRIRLTNDEGAGDAYFVGVADVFRPRRTGELQWDWKNLVILKLLKKSGSQFALFGYRFHVPPGSEANFEGEYQFPARGELTVEPCKCVSHFPFGFFLKSRGVGEEERIVVLPRVRKLDLLKLSRLTRLDFIALFQSRGEGQYLSHLNEVDYQESTRRIHWKHLASRDKLARKEFEGSDHRHVQVAFDARLAPAFSGDELVVAEEDQLSFLASVLVTFLNKGWRVDFVWPDGRTQSGKGEGYRRELLLALARFEYRPFRDSGGGAILELINAHGPFTLVFSENTGFPTGRDGVKTKINVMTVEQWRRLD